MAHGQNGLLNLSSQPQHAHTFTPHLFAPAPWLFAVLEQYFHSTFPLYLLAISRHLYIEVSPTGKPIGNSPLLVIQADMSN